MSEKRRRTLIQILAVVPYLLLLYILQGTILPHIRLFGAKPLIIPLAVVGIALFDGKNAGGFFGLIAGMLCDMCYNQPTIECTLIFTFIGLCVGLLSETVLVKGFPSYLCCCAAVLIICSFSEVFPALFSYNAPISVLCDIALRQTAASAIFILPFYYVSVFVSRLL